MARYDFFCEACDFTDEVDRPIANRDEPQQCGWCKGPMRRLISRPGIQFKGDCWSHDGYTTKREGE